MEWLEVLISASFWVATVRIATPLIFGTLGELVGERAGVMNLGVEGIMTAGAFCGWAAVYGGANIWLGVAAAFLVGMLFGALHAYLTINLALSQHVTGLGITMFATSLTYFLYRMLFPNFSTPPGIEPFAVVPIPLLSAIPVLGPALFMQTPLTYIAFLLAFAILYILYKTPLGLAVRIVGENTAAAEAQGIDVICVRLVIVIFGAGVMAVGGAFLTLSAFNAFFFNMINGRGWICVALVVFSSWRPGKAVWSALLFAAFDAYQIRLQQIIGAAVPYQIFLMLPYILSILALMLVSRRASVPQALMVPYRKGE
jgi:general nucleoside transport system permease protein